MVVRDDVPLLVEDDSGAQGIALVRGDGDGYDGVGHRGRDRLPVGGLTGAVDGLGRVTGGDRGGRGRGVRRGAPAAGVQVPDRCDGATGAQQGGDHRGGHEGEPTRSSTSASAALTAGGTRRRVEGLPRCAQRRIGAGARLRAARCRTGATGRRRGDVVAAGRCRNARVGRAEVRLLPLVGLLSGGLVIERRRLLRDVGRVLVLLVGLLERLLLRLRVDRRRLIRGEHRRGLVRRHLLGVSGVLPGRGRNGVGDRLGLRGIGVIGLRGGVVADLVRRRVRGRTRGFASRDRLSRCSLTCSGRGVDTGMTTVRRLVGLGRPIGLRMRLVVTAHLCVPPRAMRPVQVRR